MNSNSNIAQHCFRASGGKPNKFIRARHRVTKSPEPPFDGLGKSFIIRNGSLQVRIPVDKPFTSVDKVLLEHLKKGGANRTGANRIEGKTGSCPIATGTDFAQLTENAFLVLIFPFPYSIDEFFSAKLMPGLAILFLDPSLNHCLGGNSSVIGSRHPKYVKSLHSAPTGENILQGAVKRMAQMKGPGNIWRRYNNAIRLALGIGVGMKKLVVFPKLQTILLRLLGLILLGQFTRHLNYPFETMDFEKVTGELHTYFASACSRSLISLYSILSTKASHEASTIFSLTPTVDHTSRLSCDSIITRTLAAVPARAFTTRTL